jgi:predicted nucleotidyltransferase
VQSRQEVVERLQAALPTLRERYGVRRLALYGSFAEERPHTRSDVDLVVELERPLGWDFVAMTHFLEQLLGRRVDLTAFECLQQAAAILHKRPIVESVYRSLQDVETHPSNAQTTDGTVAYGFRRV